EYSATGEIIYDFIKQTNIITLDKNEAECIYAAIMTDTGSFRFERTSPKIHLIAADLLELGVNPGDVYDKIYDQGKFSRIKLLGSALASMKRCGKVEAICYMVIKQKTFEETGAEEFDTDGFVNFALSVDGAKIGMMFIELKDGFKVSFRSKGTIPVNKLAGVYGGGGHVNAAGARLHGKKMDEMLSGILLEAEKYL
ncbi:MAG: bifunctional oligoribonuclease/PAP phosphatase NrnA, partial [Ignavibacteriaceae bacterium]|nr:bifunctional oligoribonuclease/PAP phosphatase NrnA [Ignavibacteriaceae bacterium]